MALELRSLLSAFHKIFKPNIDKGVRTRML